MSELPGTLPAALRRAVNAYGDHPAFVEDGRSTSFSDLLARVRRAAAAYVEHGLAPGQCVAIWAPNSVDWAIAGLAVTWAGGALVPLNSRYTAHEVVDILDRTGAAIVVVADGFLGRHQIDELTALGTSSVVVDLADLVTATPDEASLARADERAAATGTDDVADILFTSGTTGRSKGVVTAHRQTIAAADVWGRTGRVSADDRYLVISPFFHSYGYKVGIVTGLLTGCTLHPLATFDPAAALALIEAERITVVPGAPAIFQGLLDHPDLPRTDTSSLRFANTGAANVPVTLVERMQHELSFELVITAYGMTECCVATMCRPGDSDETVATSCGRAVDGLELRIVDPHTAEELEAGAEGEVQLRGPMVMLRYLDDPVATAETIDPDGWLATGDVGVLDEHGYLRITDRLKDMYICGGFNVYPAEVEQQLARLDGVADVAVIGVPDERLGEVGRAFVVRREGPAGAHLEASAVIAFARERLANFKAPRSVAFVDALPRNLAGKVLKNELRSSDD
jgi:acyl-CoA synthetase (AMP-forming)/AMP-acid ligase II